MGGCRSVGTGEVRVGAASGDDAEDEVEVEVRSGLHRFQNTECRNFVS